MSVLCEVCTTERAVMLVYAKNPDTQTVEPKRGDNPFYPPEEAHIALNVCVPCFWDMTDTMRQENYIAIRATAVRLNKPAPPPEAL